jgi:translation initiation factor 3 subunit H
MNACYQVVTKILKHSGEAAQRAQGLLLGLDLDGVLEVSNSFPLPIYSGEDEEKVSKSTSA